MINKFYTEVCDGLQQIRECTIYREDVPQFFVRPCFLVTLYDQNPTRGINGRLKNTIRADILYFPEDKTNYQEECWRIGQELHREFALKTFKLANRNLKITDEVLHFLFDVKYQEYREETGVSRMQTVSQNTNIKEDE